MPKLVGLNEKYKDKGLVMIFVGYESKSKLEAYTRQYNITWPFAIESTKSALKAYGVRGYPTSFVIDPEGKVAWKGHPASKELEKVIIELLPKVWIEDGDKLPKEPMKLRLKGGLCEEMKEASGKAKEGSLGKARQIAQKLIDKTNASEKDRKDAVYVKDAVEKRSGLLFAEAERLIAEKLIFDAIEFLKEIKKAFTGEPEADKAAKMAEELEASEQYQKELEAADMFKRAMYHMGRGRPSNAKNYFKKIIKQFPDSSFAKKSREELEKLDK